MIVSNDDTFDKKTEIQFRISSLVSQKDKYDQKKICIYGTGDNAKVLLDFLTDQDVIALIDKEKVGKYLFNKLIVDLEDSLLLGTEVIIIAASVPATLIVSDRIWKFCLSNNILLLNMYGADEIERKKIYLSLKTKYPAVTAESISRTIEKKDVICFQLNNIIYNEMADANKELIPRRGIIEVAIRAINNGKKVYFIDETDQSIENVDGCLKKNGISNYEKVIKTKVGSLYKEDALRKGLGVDFYNEKKLYIGEDSSLNSFLAYVYGSEIVLLKKTWDILLQFFKLDITQDQSEKLLSEENRRFVLEKFSSPFVDDISECFLKKGYLIEKIASKNTVVFVCPSVPKYDCAAGWRTIYQYMKLFIDKDYKVDLVIFDKNDLESYSIHFESLGINIISSDNDPYYHKWFFLHASEISIAFISFPYCYDSLLNVLKIAGIKTYYYGVDLHFVRNHREYELLHDEYYKRLSEANFQLERKLIGAADVSFYPSEEEVRTVKKYFDLEAHYLSPFYFENNYKGVYKANQRDGLFFIGGYKHAPNVDAVKWFINEVFPLIRDKLEVDFYMAGADEPDELKILNREGVIHLGRVSDEELENIYNRIKMVVIPLRYGAGVKGKVIEAMHHGIPIVSTSIGIEGIPEAENYFEMGESAEEFANGVIRLYMDENRLNKMSKEFVSLSEKYYSKKHAWDSIKNAAMDNGLV